MIGAKNGTCGELSRSIQIFPWLEPLAIAVVARAGGAIGVPAVDLASSAMTRCWLSNESPGNIGSERISDAARSAIGKSPGRKNSPSNALERWSGIG